MSCPPLSACQDWILASIPSSPSLMVSAEFTESFPTVHLEGKTNREWPGEISHQEVLTQSVVPVVGILLP